MSSTSTPTAPPEPRSGAPWTLPPAHHFTVDVEEYFQVSAFEGVVRRCDWPLHPSRLAENMAVLLDMMAAAGVSGTFFVLGCVAARQPWLVRRISEHGHEVASHGYDHRRLGSVTPAQLRRSVQETRRRLEDITGRRVQGFRAPSYSLTPGREWALDVLIEEGYRYDSSLFPIRRPGYGYPTADRDPFWVHRPSGRIAEVAPATVRWMGVNLPAAGGAYLRLLPFGLVREGLREAERRGMPATLYIHPWELDPDQPRLECGRATRLRHYGGLHRVQPRLRKLLREFRFTPIAHTVARLA